MFVSWIAFLLIGMYTKNSVKGTKMLEQRIRNYASEKFGFSSFRPGQLDIIKTVMSSENCLGVLPTGAGKSLCFQLPALMHESGITLVVSPLLALMSDQVKSLRQRGIPAARLDSSLSFEEAKDALRSVTDGKTRILYVSPERFKNEGFMKQIKSVPIALMVVDEAHW
jgi:ATP-dependent DNA helicase RecQ